MKIDLNEKPMSYVFKWLDLVDKWTVKNEPS